MRELTNDEIEKLSSRKGVKKIAVENFLSSLDDLSVSDAYSNLRLDTRMYKWNSATVKAINDGIKKALS
jgi:hypothetical protein